MINGRSVSSASILLEFIRPLTSLVLDHITNSYASAVKHNSNYDAIEEAVHDSVSKSEVSIMEVDIDLNDNQLINTGEPTLDHHVMRKIDIDQGIGPAILAVAAIVDEVVNVSDHVSDILITNSNADDIETVADNISAVVTVAADIGVVSDNLSNIGIVADNIDDVVTVGSNIASVILVANNLDDIDGAVNDAAAVLSDGNLTNVRLAKAANYTVTAADARKTIAMTAFMTLTYGAPAGYNAEHSNVILNDTSWGSRVAQLISISGYGTIRLWPGQSMRIYNQANTWHVDAERAVGPAGDFIINIDPALGSDVTGDGLGTGARAFASSMGAIYRFYDEVKSQAATQTRLNFQIVQGGNDTGGLHWAPHAYGQTAQGGAAFKISGAGTGATISGVECAFYFGAVVQLQNLTLACTNNNIIALWGSKIYIDDVDFAGSPAGSHIYVSEFSQVEMASGCSVSTGAGAWISAVGGEFRSLGQSWDFTANCAFSGVVGATDHGRINFAGTTINLNAHTITGPRFYVATGGYIRTSNAAGSQTYFPGNSFATCGFGFYDGGVSLNADFVGLGSSSTSTLGSTAGQNTLAIKGGITTVNDGSGLGFVNGASTIGVLGNRSALFGGGYNADFVVAGNGIFFTNASGGALGSIDTNGRYTNIAPPVVPTYTVGTLPSAATAAQMAYCSNETGGAVLVFSDGTNWRRVTDRAVAS